MTKINSIFILGCLTISSCGIFKSGIKVKNTPESFSGIAYKEATVNENAGGSGHWVVFSDRANNLSYAEPDGSKIFKTIGFMDFFYVTGEKNGYLHIVKYDPALLKKNKIKDPKLMQDFGWIAGSNLLQWSQALVSNQDNYPVKAISVVNDKAVFEQPEQYLNFDSVRVFEAPSLQSPSKCGLKLNELFYIYKTTADNKFVLIGKKEQLVANAVTRDDIFGWIPAALVHPWGTRLYITAVLQEKGSVEQLENTVNAAISVNNNTGGKVWHYTPVTDTYLNVLNNFPIYNTAIAAGNNSNAIATTIPAHLLDVQQAAVINAKGELFSHQQYLDLHNNIRKLNLVFLLDGGSSMKKYFPALVNFFQGLQNSLSSTGRYANDVSYGAVVYRNKNNCSLAKSIIESTAMTTDAESVTDFIFKQVAETNGCTDGTETQPLFAGIQKAIELFPTNRFQENIIILVGTTGNDSESGRGAETEMINNLSQANVKIFAFQPYSDYFASFNNFVLQVKDLLERSAANLAEQKKSWIVKSDDLVFTQKYNSRFKDSTAYYLDFPSSSMIPGGILFPTKGSTGSYKDFTGFVIRTIDQAKNNNQYLVNSLDSAFTRTGIQKSKLNPMMPPELIATDSSNWFKDLSYNGYRFFLKGEISNIAIDSADALKYSLILSEYELASIQHLLSTISYDDAAAGNSALRQKIYSNLLQAVKVQDKGNKTHKETEEISLAKAFQIITGLPNQNPLLSSYKINDIPNSHLSDNDFNALLLYFRKVNDNLKLRLSADKTFISAGQPYYILSQDVFDK